MSDIPIPPLPTKGAGPQIAAQSHQGLVCISKPSPEKMLETNSETLEGVPREFFSEAVLEHPSIAGLLLTREQRLCKERLQYTNQNDGDILHETIHQMLNRTKWRAVQKPTPSRTANDFVPMNTNLFKAD